MLADAWSVGLGTIGYSIGYSIVAFQVASRIFYDWNFYTIVLD